MGCSSNHFQESCPTSYTNTELKLEIRRLKTCLHQSLSEDHPLETHYSLSCRIDDLVLEYQKRVKPYGKNL